MRELKPKMTIHCDHCEHCEPVYHFGPHLAGRRCRVCSEVMVSAADYRALRRTLVWAFLSAFLARLFPSLPTRQMRARIKDGRVSFGEPR